MTRIFHRVRFVQGVKDPSETFVNSQKQGLHYFITGRADLIREFKTSRTFVCATAPINAKGVQRSGGFASLFQAIEWLTQNAEFQMALTRRLQEENETKTKEPSEA